MTEIYEERFEQHKYEYEGAGQALEEALDLVLERYKDDDEQLKIALEQLGRIAHENNNPTYYIHLLIERIRKRD